MRDRIEIWKRGALPATSRIAHDFGAIVRSERLPQLFESLPRLGGIVVASIGEDELRGYATLVPSSALGPERWESVPDTFELGSIEVARAWRGRGIGTSLLARLDETLPVDRLLVFARGFVGHWETTVAMLSPAHYRRMLLRMLGRAGFRLWETDDPEVEDHPLNFLALRAGRDVPASSLLAWARCARSGD